MASVELYDGVDPQVLDFPVHTTHGSFKAGDLVKLVSGKLKIATAGVILGIARSDYNKTNPQGNVDVELINPNSIYSVRYKSSATAQTLVGDLVDFTFTAGAHYVDESGASTDAYVVGLDPRDAVGTTAGRLLIRFKSSLLTSQF